MERNSQFFIAKSTGRSLCVDSQRCVHESFRRYIISSALILAHSHHIPNQK
jgi:hypothetical protein